MSVSATSSASSLATPGIGSGLDVNGLVSKLMAVESLPLNQLSTQQASYQSDLTAYGQIKGALSSFQTAAQALATPANFTVSKASVADTSILAAASSSSAVAGTYNVAVTSLAQAEKLATATGVANTTTAQGTGTLTISIGKYSTDSGGTTTFAANSGATKSITLDSSNNSLAGIRDAINAANAGVTASIVNDGTATGNHLVIASNSTGTTNAIQISVADANGKPPSDPAFDAASTGLANLAYDASTAAASTSKMTESATAKDAVIVVDGMTVTKPSNTITDAIQGVTLNLSKLSADSTTPDPKNPGKFLPATTAVTISKDTSSIQSSIQALVSAYNSVNSTLKLESSYTASTNTSSPLTGDSTVRSIQNQLRNLFNNAVSGAASGTSRLAEIGITFQKDGSLAADSSKLSAALADPNRDVSKIFAKTTSSTGYASQIDTMVGSMLAKGGLLTSRTDGINTAITGIGKQQDALKARLATIQKNYMTQFNNLDSMLSSMNSTSSYLTTQLSSIAALTKQSA